MSRAPQSRHVKREPIRQADVAGVRPAQYDACMAVAVGVDEATRASDLVWGAGRLPLIVSDTTRARFRIACRLWREAVRSWNPDTVRTQGAMMTRALATLALEAAEMGAAPLSPTVLDVALSDGRVLSVVATAADAHHVANDGRHTLVISMQEVARLFEAQSDAATLILTEFPGAAVSRTVVATAGYARDWSVSEPLLDDLWDAPVIPDDDGAS